MVISALLPLSVPIFFATGAVSLLTLWSLRFPQLSLWMLGATVIAGQLGRLPLGGQGGGLLASDIGASLVVLAALVHALRQRQFPTRVLWLSLPFIVWSVTILLAGQHWRSWFELGVAGAYWLRLATLLLLLPAVIVLCSRVSVRQTTKAVLLTIVVGLVLLGALQLWLWPSLTANAGGWDPHHYRLVATWLDPNFIGGFFAVVLPWLVAQSLRGRGHNHRGWWLLTSLVLLELFLTQSRSSLVALILGGLIMAPLMLFFLPAVRRSTLARATCVGLALGCLVILAGLLGGERVVGLVTYDPTVVLRLQGLSSAWSLASAYSLTGVGYNAYQFVAHEAGLISSYTIHSRAGADNSWLTLWVTTGSIGMVLFILPWSWVVHQLLARLPRFPRTALPALTSLLIWCIHSQFVNSLLYAHLMIVMALLVSYELTASRPHV